ncbi:MAG: hypothetical protein Q8936_17015 [Bacillota bacterium]|nr:hypothetical protein [Bacillota bacterium]
MNDIKRCKEGKTVSVKNYIFDLNLKDGIRATMFGTLDGISTDVLHMPLHMPGHTSIWWMGILVFGKGIIPRFGSGIIMGIVSGILAVFMGLGKEGIFVFLKYFVPGLLIDFMAPLFIYKLDSILVGGVCGAIISLSKLFASILVGILTKIPLLFLVIGLGYVALSHVIFGAIGGVLASIIIKRLKTRIVNVF